MQAIAQSSASRNPARDSILTEEERQAAPLVALCCRLLGLAFNQIEAFASKPPPKGKRNSGHKASLIRHDALEAQWWIMADDRMHVLSYLNCCEALGLDPERGRAWARATLAKIKKG